VIGVARVTLLAAVLVAVAFAATAAARQPGEGPLGKAEIKMVMESSLPGATFEYRRIPSTGAGAVVAGKAVSKRGQTFFKIVSGDPVFDRRRYIPRRVIAPTGVVDDDLLTRVAQGSRRGRPPINLHMSVALLIDLCDYRVGHECGA